MEESSIISLIQSSEERINAATQASEERIVAAIREARRESKADLSAHQDHDDKRFDAIQKRRSWPPARPRGWVAVLVAALGSGGGAGYLLRHCQANVAIAPAAAQTSGEVRR